MLYSQPSTSFGAVTDLRLGDHLCLPVGSDEERLAYTAELSEHALLRGGRALVLTYTETADEMAAQLAERVPGAGAALALGQLVVQDSVGSQLVGGVFDPQRATSVLLAHLEQTMQDGYRGLWVVDDMAWGRAGLAGIEALLDYEASGNRLFLGQPIAAACVYDLRVFPKALIEQYCSAHPVTLGQAALRFTGTADPPGLALHGEADFTNRRALTAVLADVQTLSGHVTIDASGLRFADLHAVRLLSAVVRARRRGTTTITGSPMVNRVMELALTAESGTGGWWDA